MIPTRKREEQLHALRRRLQGEMALQRNRLSYALRHPLPSAGEWTAREPSDRVAAERSIRRLGRMLGRVTARLSLVGEPWFISSGSLS